jgi:hypothetical protein
VEGTLQILVQKVPGSGQFLKKTKTTFFKKCLGVTLRVEGVRRFLEKCKNPEYFFLLKRLVIW